MVKKLLHKLISRVFGFYEGTILKDKDFIIVSNNCWGYKTYQYTNKPYNTPFIGCFIPPNDYIQLCRNLKYYLTQEIKPIEGVSSHTGKVEQYPIGVICNNIEVHFLHYDCINIAIKKWERRAEKLLMDYNYSIVLYKFCIKDGANKKQIDDFHNFLKGENKISFTNFNIDHDDNINLQDFYCERGEFPDGLKLFELRYKYGSLVKLMLQKR